MAANGRNMLQFVALAGVASTFLAGCGSNHYQSAPPPEAHDRDVPRTESVVASKGGGLFSSSKKEDTGVEVNAFLWRASLDTVAFMPLLSADPFGGVILSDWYGPSETPDERFKVNIYIISKNLRADGLKVSIFRQTRDPGGQWKDSNVGPEVATEFENAVLTRARDLRLRTVPQDN